MSRYNLLIFILLCSVVLLFTAFSFTKLQQTMTVINSPELTEKNIPPLTLISETHPSVPNGPLIFTGDVLLARNVEQLMKRHGPAYPFLYLQDVFARSNAVVANFESAIPNRHIPTPAYTFAFSTNAAYVPLLRQIGITHVSLANNHATDYGEVGYNESIATLQASNITPFGHPRVLATTSITYIEQDGYRIGILGIHTLFVAPQKSQLEALLKEMSNQSDLQIAYIHWGTEYEDSHNLAQRALADTLIDMGIDTIIGHHPHVTQDIQIIKNVPVFFSLGNLIFDQYFSIAVQQGYLLGLSITENKLNYSLIPVTSIGSFSQPRLMDQSEKNVFLTNLASRSDQTHSENIKQGKVIVSFSLATSTKNSIISP